MARKTVEETGCSSKACHPVSQVPTARKVETNTSTPVQGIHMGSSVYSLYCCLVYFPRTCCYDKNTITKPTFCLFERKGLLWFTVQGYSVLWWES